MPDERERKVATLAEGKRKVGVHQRPLTLDAGVNRDGSEGEGVSNKIEDTAGIVNVPNGFAREHAAAGWPSWLVSVAGEAVKGWLPRKANSFEKLYKGYYGDPIQRIQYSGPLITPGGNIEDMIKEHEKQFAKQGWIK